VTPNRAQKKKGEMNIDFISATELRTQKTIPTEKKIRGVEELGSGE